MVEVKKTTKTKSTEEKAPKITKAIKEKTSDKTALKAKTPKTKVSDKAESTPKKASVKTSAKAEKINVEKTEKVEKVNVEKVSIKRESSSKDVQKADFSNIKELNSKIFEFEKNYDQAIFDCILSERASRRQGTHKVKNRAEVSGTGKKPWKQKGTGKARAGSLRNPIFVGGGRAFGPSVNRNYKISINKKVRLNALMASLFALAKSNSVLLKTFSLEKPSTKDLVEELRKINASNLKRILLVSDDKNIFLSARNLKNVKVTKVTSLMIEDLVAADLLILSNENIKYLEGLIK